MFTAIVLLEIDADPPLTYFCTKPPPPNAEFPLIVLCVRFRLYLESTPPPMKSA